MNKRTFFKQLLLNFSDGKVHSSSSAPVTPLDKDIVATQPPRSISGIEVPLSSKTSNINKEAIFKQPSTSDKTFKDQVEVDSSNSKKTSSGQVEETTCISEKTFKEDPDNNDSNSSRDKTAKSSNDLEQEHSVNKTNEEWNWGWGSSIMVMSQDSSPLHGKYLSINPPTKSSF